LFCKDRGIKLNADHIVPLSFLIKENNIKTTKDAIECDKIWNINNGRTLCVNCHKKTDTYLGKAKNYADRTRH
jgi:5-methylcytosine-specific restriction endonuclease McrA